MQRPGEIENVYEIIHARTGIQTVRVLGGSHIVGRCGIARSDAAGREAPGVRAGYSITSRKREK